MIEKKRLLLYCSGIDEILGDTNRVGGIQVQMMFWGESFAEHGWKVYALSDGKPQGKSHDLNFIQVPSYKLLSRIHLEIIQDITQMVYSICKCKPNLVMLRGASRGLFFLYVFCKIKGIKLVFLGASDSDFIPGREIIAGSSINRNLYQKALKRVNYIVTQNKEQYSALKENYRKDSLTLANIWIPCVSNGSFDRHYDVIWVAYLRPLKRAEWFLDLAQKLPQYKFAIAGGVSDQTYYNKIEKEATEINNLSFLGALSFEGINKLMAQSKLLVCTSEFEGFPNTFLQAWAQKIPVVSTVNPSDVVSQYQLGIVVSDTKELEDQTIRLLEDEMLYANYQLAINDYFLIHHDSTNAYKKLIDYLKE